MANHIDQWLECYIIGMRVIDADLLVMTLHSLMRMWSNLNAIHSMLI